MLVLMLCRVDSVKEVGGSRVCPSSFKLKERLELRSPCKNMRFRVDFLSVERRRRTSRCVATWSRKTKKPCVLTRSVNNHWSMMWSSPTRMSPMPHVRPSSMVRLMNVRRRKRLRLLSAVATVSVDILYTTAKKMVTLKRKRVASGVTKPMKNGKS